MLSPARSIDHEAPQTPRFRSEDERWDAVLRRDRAAEGAFVYAVRTTGVYCRPTCAARRPQRENVAFHATAADAERAGFRPCRRCRPGEAALAERQAAAVAKACRLIEAAEEMPGLDALAKAAGMSRFHFHRVFKAVTGVTPKAYADAHVPGGCGTSLRRGRPSPRRSMARASTLAAGSMPPRATCSA